MQYSICQRMSRKSFSQKRYKQRILLQPLQSCQDYSMTMKDHEIGMEGSLRGVVAAAMALEVSAAMVQEVVAAAMAQEEVAEEIGLLRLQGIREQVATGVGGVAEALGVIEDRRAHGVMSAAAALTEDKTFPMDPVTAGGLLLKDVIFVVRSDIELLSVQEDECFNHHASLLVKKL